MSVTLEPGTRIGEYEILAPLRAGGMASLYLGRRAGVAGFSKPVAIKVIHTHLATDPTFVRMFLDEARLSARIDDPHVVHVEDLGEADGMLYLAMEYVLGVSLAALLARLVQGGTPLDPPVACAIAMRVADGLHAAHQLEDEHGVSLEVVHRDVSPQNVLVSEAGHVKLIDFGVARARGRMQETEAGALKGKLRYMSPEQAWGKPIDRRTDVYALGIVLWEMLVLRRFIEGDNDIEALELARAPVLVPPSQLRPGLSADLDHVVLTALARDPEERYATAQAFRRALAGAVPEALRVEPGDLAALVEGHFARQLATERKLLHARESAPSPAEPAETATLAEATRAGSRARRERASEPAPPPAPPVASAASSANEARGVAGPTPPREPAPRAPRALLAAAALMGLGGAGLAAAAWSGAFAPPPASSSPIVPAPASTTAAPVVARDPCVSVARIEAQLGQTVSTDFDTHADTSAFALTGLRNPDADSAPDHVVEIAVPGTARTTVEISTGTPRTDERFDTIFAVFDGPCRADMTGARPTFTADDHGRHRHARGALGARGGSILTLVVSGFGGDELALADRGRVGLDVSAREATPPVLSTVRGVVAGEQVVFTVDGTDTDLDADRARVRLFDAAGGPLALVSRGQRAALPEHWLLLPEQLEAAVSGEAHLLVAAADAERLARASAAELSLVDDAGNVTPPRSLELVHAEEVGPGARCDASHVCAAELACGEAGECFSSSDREMACLGAHALALSAEAPTRAERMLPPGDALFEASCAETSARGREDVLVLTIPDGRWDLVLGTEPAEERAAPEDMVLTVRRDCLDARLDRAPAGACSDDRSADSRRPRVELRDVRAGERLYVLASAKRSEPRFETGGLAYVMIARLRAVRAEGDACDPTMTTDRCESGECDATRRVCMR